jgi:hypothetical protein
MLRAASVVVIAWLAASATATQVRAVADSETATFDPSATSPPYYTYTYTYDTSEPTVANWTSGWGESGVTGWDYVGYDNGASAVYLGNGFVLTAAHVGAGDFYIGNEEYAEISGTATQIGTSDLTLYQINTTSTTGNVLTLPSLTLPVQGTDPAVGTSVVMIGYGNGAGEAWAANTVSQNNQVVTLSASESSLDFFTADSFSEVNNNPDVTTTSNGQLVPGDSGGGDFVYNSVTHQWVLVGINEVLLEDNTTKIVGSGTVQTGSYAALIDADMAAAPEPPSWLLALTGLATIGAVGAARRSLRRAI